MFILAQVFSAIGAVLLLYSTFSETKEEMLKIQIFDASANAIADALLGGWAGVMLNIVAIFRNVTTIKKKINNAILIGLLAFTAIISVCANKSGFLPLIAEMEYTFAVGKCDLLKSKVALAINLLLWLFYDLILRSYPIAIADLVILISTLVSINKLSNENAKGQRITQINFSDSKK